MSRRLVTLRYRFVAAVCMVGVLVGAGAGVASAQENPLEPLDTSSPQATYLSFLEQEELLEDLLLTYERSRSEANQLALVAAMEKVEELFDLSEVSEANRDEAVGSSFAYLADILNRIPPPDLDEIPDIDDVEEALDPENLGLLGSESALTRPVDGITSVVLPGSQITITRIEEGARVGNYVFSADTVANLPEWRDRVDGLPVNDGTEVRDWVDREQNFTGHLVPRAWINSLPDTFDRNVLGTPLWKVIADIVTLGLVALSVVAWHRLIGRRGEPDTVGAYGFRLSTPAVLLVAIAMARRFMDEQISHSGEIATIANTIVTLTVWTAIAWGFWVATHLVVEWIIRTPRISDDSIDAHLLRVLAKVVSVAGAAVFVAAGWSRVGVSTVGLGIGAGVVGLAVGLAATSTLENLLGGITVYVDKPFRVGDDIRVDDEFGEVEAIGPRSTRIRRLDDTQVTLPNADISRAKVTNYSRRNHILFVHIVGVRYETTLEQLRVIVDAIDTRFREHPMVLDEANFPRVRVCGFGASSIDIEVRAHVDTNRFSRFTGVQQELLLMIHEIVDAAGSGFAFPSTTTYLTQDSGLPEAGDPGAITAPERAGTLVAERSSDTYEPGVETDESDAD